MSAINEDSWTDEVVPEGSEQLDQMESDRTLLDRGLRDSLEEGYVAPDRWSAAEGYGNTAAEMRRGETFAQRLKQELPDDLGDLDSEDNVEDLDDHEVGNRRAGRLVDANQGYADEDREAQLLGSDVGIDGAAASAEEAAMHVIDDYEVDED